MGAVAGSPRSQARRRLRIGPLVLALPAVAFVAAFLLAPLVAFAAYSLLTASLFDAAGPATVANYGDALTSSVNHTLARNSFVIGLATAVTCLVIGLPFAHWLRFSAGRWRGVVLALIVITMFAGYLVRIYAWRSILGQSGLLNRGLEGLGLIDGPLGFLIYSRFAVVVALVHILLPYVVLILYAGFTPVSPLLVEAAEDLGASRMQCWRRLFLPLLAAPAASAFVLVFVLAAADYVTPQFLGGTNGQMLGVEVQANFLSVGNWALGAATAFLMLACFALCYGIAALALRRAKLDRVQWVG